MPEPLGPVHRANHDVGGRASPALGQLREAARMARDLGLAVHAGHGLTYLNVGPVAALGDIEELNIGHSIMSRAILTGMDEAVRTMARLVRKARSLPASDGAG